MLSINDIVYALFDTMKRCRLCGMFVDGFSYTLRTVYQAKYDVYKQEKIFLLTSL